MSAATEATDAAFVAALLALHGMGPVRLERVVAWAGSPEAAWHALQRADRGVGLAAAEAAHWPQWSAASRRIDPSEMLERHRRAGVSLLGRGMRGYPARLLDDPEAPALLFVRGSLAALDVCPVVALVGTRRASAYGLRLARDWGHRLAEAGVVVVSGLASGIDAAAHEGALGSHGGRGSGRGPDRDESSVAAPPVGVVGTGLDVAYPASSRSLWQRVGSAGALVSESPLGTRPEAWRFPARNRIIAGLADAVVVIESHARGGALLTADAADLRGRTVLAVPGSVHAPTSSGTNALIAAGALLATGVEDILSALGSRARASPVGAAGGARPAGGRSTTPTSSGSQDHDERAFLNALGWEPATLDDLVERTGWSLGRACGVLEALLGRSVVTQNGPWFTQAGD